MKKIFASSLLMGLFTTPSFAVENIQQTVTASLCRTVNTLFHSPSENNLFSMYYQNAHYTVTITDGRTKNIELLTGAREVINSISCDSELGTVEIKAVTFYPTKETIEGESESKLTDRVFAQIHNFYISTSGKVTKTTTFIDNEPNAVADEPSIYNVVEFDEKNPRLHYYSLQDDRDLEQPVKRCRIQNAEGVEVKYYCRTSAGFTYHFDADTKETLFDIDKVGVIYDDNLQVIESLGWIQKLEKTQTSDFSRVREVTL